MVEAEPLPAGFRRALEGLQEGTGRTLLVAGPEASGKSALLERFTSEAAQHGATVRSITATYRERTTPFAAVLPLASAEEARTEEEAPLGEDGEVDATAEEGALSPSMFVPPVASSSRRRRGERQRGRVMGQAYAVRSKGIERMDAATFWAETCERFRTDRGHRLVIVVDDAVYADDESREFLAYLSDRARLRPLVLVVALDSSVPAFGAWEERLGGRPGVDWVRSETPAVDPREASRLKRALEALSRETRRLLLITALLGGSVSEVMLARTARLTFHELGDALLPATEAHLVRLEDQKIVIPHLPWVQFLPELASPGEIRALNAEIAEALEAMHPEPDLAHRRQLAARQFAADRGPVALRYLIECAELSYRLSAYDDVDGFLDKALQCVGSLPLADRAPAEAEIRLFRARALFLSGRPSEAEKEMAEGVGLAIPCWVSGTRIEEWIEPLVPLLQSMGPRPSLVTLLVELLDRLHTVGDATTEGLLALTLTALESQRDRPDRARKESHRVAQLAWATGGAPLQAVALLAVGLARAAGSPTEWARADRFLQSAAVSLGNLRRPELEQLAIDYRPRVLALRGDRDAALTLHLRAVPILQRLRMPTLEADHELGIAEILFDRAPEPRGLRALKRAHELVESLHLAPPAADLLRLWLLTGRKAAFDGEVDRARDYFSAVADRTGSPALGSIRGEAALRLCVLEALHGREEEAERYFARKDVAALFRGEPPSWPTWVVELRGAGDRPASGGAAVPVLLHPGSSP